MLVDGLHFDRVGIIEVRGPDRLGKHANVTETLQIVLDELLLRILLLPVQCVPNVGGIPIFR